MKGQLSPGKILNRGECLRCLLLNYLHFKFQEWISRKLLFFLADPSSRNIRTPPNVSTFSLIETDAKGIAQPLPAELGVLPLYLHDDGFYSVIGPLLSQATPQDHNNGFADRTLAYNRDNNLAALSPLRRRVFCGLSKCSGNRFASPSTVLCANPPRRLTWKSGPHTCSRRSYTCNAPDCTRPTPFRTKQALNRHYEVIHHAERFDCPVPGCKNVGENGIKRHDNLMAHMRNKHGVPPAGGSCMD